MAELFNPRKLFEERPDEIHLRLVKTHDKEVICDQHGRVLNGVRGFRYEQVGVETVPILTLELMINPCGWDDHLGVIKGGEGVSLEPRPFGEKTKS
jgi:hypothetical protein